MNNSITVKKIKVEYEFEGQQRVVTLSARWLTGLENVTVATERPSNNGPTGDIEEMNLLDYIMAGEIPFHD